MSLPPNHAAGAGAGVTPAPPARQPVTTFLVTGARAGLREAAIAQALMPALPTAIILEGLSDGSDALAVDAPASVAGNPDLLLQIHRIAPGCLHCSGNLVLRVTLNRVLRRPPARLYISLASAEHIEQLRTWLSEAPYDDLLSLQSDIAA